jgi:hypothetical protein
MVQALPISGGSWSLPEVPPQDSDDFRRTEFPRNLDHHPADRIAGTGAQHDAAIIEQGHDHHGA